MGGWGRGGETDVNLRPNVLKLFCWEFSIVSFTVGGGGRRETAEGWSLLYGAPVASWEVVVVVAVTCGCIADDSQPGRLIGLPYIIGHFTYILPALLLRHIVEGQHLSVRAIDPRVLQIKTRQVQHSRHLTAGRDQASHHTTVSKGAPNLQARKRSTETLREAGRFSVPPPINRGRQIARRLLGHLRS